MNHCFNTYKAEEKFQLMKHPLNKPKERDWILSQESSISNLDVWDFDEDITSKEDSSFSSESSTTESSTTEEDENDQETMHIDDISVGGFAVVKYDYSRTVKYYVGECMRKDNNGDIVFIFLEQVSGMLFKYRENVIQEAAKVNMVKHIYSLFSIHYTKRKIAGLYLF